MDKIILQGCQFYGYHGVFEEEQRLGQIFIIDCELTVDLTLAGTSDDVVDTVHYGHVFEIIKQQAENKRYLLLEKLAQEICTNLFNQFEAVKVIRLKVMKPNPPIAGHYQSVGIEIERKRMNHA